MDSLKPHIAEIAAGRTLDEEQAEAAFEILMSGEASPAQIGGLLMGLRARGETAAELTGAARVMRRKAASVTAPPASIDCCGTGGDGLKTYNISTAVGFVLAACGVPVAKHGNRAASSRSGAADVLAALGVNLDADFAVLEKALHEVGFCFLMAPRHHAAMRHVGPVRQELGSRTIFNLLGPLANPAGTKRQLIGVFDGDYLEMMAQVLHGLGSEAAWVVHGADGMDELTVTGPTEVSALKDGAIERFTVIPEQAGLRRHSLEALTGGDAETNAAALHAVLSGDKDAYAAYRDIVLINAAAALIVADKAADLETGADLAASAIDEGRALAVLDTYIARTTAAA